MSKYQKESELQEFKFGPNERIAGHLPAFVAPKSHIPHSQNTPILASPTASMGDQLEFTIIDQTIREQQAAAKRYALKKNHTFVRVYWLSTAAVVVIQWPASPSKACSFTLAMQSMKCVPEYVEVDTIVTRYT